MSPPTPIAPGPHRWTVEWVDEIESTQDELLKRCDAGELVDRTAFAARFQSKGRGRLDRRWDAPAAANLLVSLGMVPVAGVAPFDPAVAMRAAALGVVATARRFGLDDVLIKWPNDVLVGDSKLAGLLAQRHDTGSVVVGVGVNVNWAPPGCARLADGATATEHVAQRLAPEDVLDVLLAEVDSFATGRGGQLDQAAVDTAYRESLGTLGRSVRVELVDGDLVGTAVDITGAGCLVLDVDGEHHIVSAGDVHHLRLSE